MDVLEIGVLRFGGVFSVSSRAQEDLTLAFEELLLSRKKIDCSNMFTLQQVNPQQTHKQIFLGAQANSDSFSFSGLRKTWELSLKQYVWDNLYLSLFEFSHTFLRPSTTKFSS